MSSELWERRPCIVLASASPRRRILLEQIGFDCEVRPVHVDESRLQGESAQRYVRRLALDKAQAPTVPDLLPGRQLPVV
ncbi:MAG: Maf family protein [Gammaproteobacteria bacterium]|nr:Maf family protein [Gammaproteobacteria bacterium]